jgi:hypothetical protein
MLCPTHKISDTLSQVNVGYFFDVAIGVKKNEAKALIGTGASCSAASFERASWLSSEP